MSYPILYDYSKAKDLYNSFKVLIEVDTGVFHGLYSVADIYSGLNRSPRLHFGGNDRPWQVITVEEAKEILVDKS